MAERCLGRNRDGSPCSAAPRASGWCMWHDPAREAERAEWRKRGGQRRSNRARAQKQLPDGLMTPVELRGLLGVVLKNVIVGRIEPGVGNAAANLARAMVSIQETQELEARIQQLEERAGLAEGRAS